MLLNMAMFCFVMVASSADGLNQDVGDEPRPTYSPEEIPRMIQSAILAEHDALRDPLMVFSLTWNQTLADYAASWAARCKDEHSGGPYGENLFLMTSNQTDRIIVAQEAVRSWGSEIDYADSPDWTCIESSCGQYSQAIWNRTESIGCAVNQCEVDTAEPWFFVVCEYSPRGNVVGEVPY